MVDKKDLLYRRVSLSIEMTGEQFRTAFDSAPKCVILTHARSEKKIALWIRMLMIGLMKRHGTGAHLGKSCNI